MRLTRDLLTSARRSFRRMRFLAWGVFAIGEPSNFLCQSAAATDAIELRHAGCPASGKRAPYRSEEHTSELQSLMRISYAVFCLKKKTINSTGHNTRYHLPCT